jgi:hypothetical protein
MLYEDGVVLVGRISVNYGWKKEVPNSWREKAGSE